MSWTPITGTADYTNGLTVTPGSTIGSHAVDPFLNTSGTQDYTTYMQGAGSKTLTPDPGNSGLSAPTAGGAAGN
jgi:hypothetical protein